MDQHLSDWLLVSDPAIRWQIGQDLLDWTEEEVLAEREKVHSQGWGAQILALQASDGYWAGAAWNRSLDSTMHALTLLREFGLLPNIPLVQKALALVRENVVWQEDPFFAGNPFFVGEIEPCINGQVAAAAAYFGQELKNILPKLLGRQLEDGGWNCDEESTKSSFNSTICVLEALREALDAGWDTPAIRQALASGEEYLLKRELFLSLHTGEPIPYDLWFKPVEGLTQPAFLQLAFPHWWKYDILRGLDYFRRANRKDARLGRAIEVLKSKQLPEGSFPLEMHYFGQDMVDFAETVGQPSRWVTLKALRVLRWYASD